MHWTVHSIRTKTKERDKKGEKYREIDMKEIEGASGRVEEI